MEPQLMKDLVQTLMQGKHTITVAFADQNLSLGEFVALAQIEDNKEGSAENVYADDLQKHLFVSKPAISQMLKSLENAGYLKREINMTNRRKLTVTLTDQGREILAKARQHYRGTINRIIQRYGPEKTRQLIELYTEFADVAKDAQQNLEQA